MLPCVISEMHFCRLNFSTGKKLGALNWERKKWGETTVFELLLDYSIISIVLFLLNLGKIKSLLCQVYYYDKNSK